ncbi:Heparinase II/III-like protein [Cohnella sp. OV330]|uniref:heparinase II/III domain-containing protein n=1 Tax=Cohnella sp. OV330 TaxID=1855288 RepID=UPI0008E9BB94|nr:heparinase II/III family protein [Cohnella sp. OV330]SFB07758.1 Heparinase II/III-like protein [Cohnella sp. OV330]
MNRERMNRILLQAADPVYTAAVERLRTEAETALRIRYEIGSSERCDWSHYYYCPKDGTRLVFDWDRPGEHHCSFCGTVCQGEPYDGAWRKLAHERIGKGARAASIYGFLANDAVAAEWAKSVLLAYAEHYEGCEIHGGIPYNGPGKLFAQTLDEAHWIIDLCDAFRFAESALTREENARVREGLLLPCARFLAAYQEEQIHNHAVLIASALSILGHLLGDPGIIRSGLEGPYGLLKQLERGVLEDGMWYEGNFHYHFYAFESLLRCAMMVEGTGSQLNGLPVLERMFNLPLGYVLPDGRLPNVNDASYGMTLADLAPYYEIAYGWFGRERYADALRLAYGMDSRGVLGAGFAPAKRDSFQALAYGHKLSNDSDGPSDSPVSLRQTVRSDASSPYCGLTKLVNRQGWHLLVKHSPFGGEHDHMDRLGLSFSVGSLPLFVDPGTTSYAVPAHYGWFKHTYSHNTVSLNGCDQPPADGERVQYLKETWGSWVESRVEWADDDDPSRYRMKGAIVLPAEMCTWDEDAYRGVRIGRIDMLTDEALLDIVRVSSPAKRDVDLLYHMSGELEEEGPEWNEWYGRLSTGSSDWINEVRRRPDEAENMQRWRVEEGALLQAGWCSHPSEVLLARTPDNPPSRQRRTWIRRVADANGRDVIFIHAFAYESNASSAEPREGASLSLCVESREEGRLHIRLSAGGSEREWELDWQHAQAYLRLIE